MADQTPPAPKSVHPMLHKFRAIRKRVDPVTLAGIIFLLLSLTVAVVGYTTSHATFDLNLLLIDYYANLSTELGSIAVVIIVVDRLNKRQSRRDHEQGRLKRQLLHDLRTPRAEDARKALDALMQRGWLWDGALQDADLSRVNLHGAVLSIHDKRSVLGVSLDDNAYPMLRGADLHQADLSRAVLNHADLRDAILINANLEGAELDGVVCNQNTVLPDESSWQSNADFARFTDPSHPSFWKPSVERAAKIHGKKEA